MLKVQVKYIELARKRKGHKCTSLTDSCDKIGCMQQLGDTAVTPHIDDCSGGTTTTIPYHPSYSPDVPLPSQNHYCT